MHKRMTLILMMALLLLAACAAPTPAEDPTPTTVPDTQPETAPTEEATAAPRPTVTPDPALEAEEGYPAPQQPNPTPYPEGYPVTETEPVVRNPYPAAEGFTVMIRAAGEQCAEGGLDYPDLRTAVSALEDAGVTVESPTSTSLAVCTACGCPTSLHFIVQVPDEDVAAAESLGWGVEE